MRESPSGRVRLRRADAGDHRLREWRNEAATRAASFNQEYVTEDEHERWLARKLRDPSARIFVVEDALGRGIGYVRFEIVDRVAEISVSIDARERGRGVGVEAIRTGSDHILTTEPVSSVVARIRRDNRASVATFERAGFRLRRYVHVSGVEACEMAYARDADSGMPTVLFRTGAGPRMGLGHLRRCFSLAAAFRRLGLGSAFVADGGAPVEDRIVRSGFVAHRLDDLTSDGGGDLESVLTVGGRSSVGTVITDSYDIDADYLQRLRAAGLFVVAIDDLARFAFPCQVVVNGGAQAAQLPYRSSSGDTQFLLGPQYALLGTEFWDLDQREIRPDVRKVLVTLGGADEANLMPELLRLLEEIPGDFRVTAIIGPFFDRRADIQRMADGCRRPVRLVEAPESMRDLMLEADLAISAGGQTLYELAVTGTPAVAVAVADNQVASMRALEARGVVQVAGVAGQAGVLHRIGALVGELADSEAARAALSRAGQHVVAGHGATAVAETIVSARSRS